MEHWLSWETDSSSSSQEIVRILWVSMFHYLFDVFHGLIRWIKFVKRATVALAFKNVILSYREYRHVSVTNLTIFRMIFLALPHWRWPNQWPKHFDHYLIELHFVNPSGSVSFLNKFALKGPPLALPWARPSPFI